MSFTSCNIAGRRLLNQQLVRPRFSDPVDVVRWMGVMQAQDFTMCQWAVGIRMKRPDSKVVCEAFHHGDLLRTHLNRGTWQLAAGEDLPWMLLLHGERCVNGWRNFALSTGSPLTDRMMDRSRELLYSQLKGGRFLAREALIPLYKTIDIHEDRVIRHLLTVAEGEGVICSGPVTGRGVSYALVEERLPQGACRLSRDEALAALATRYFQSHAPASLTDFVWWSGLTSAECRQGMEMIGEDLSTVKVDGVTYFLHKGNFEGRVTKWPVHLLPPFDELLIGYKDRSAVVPALYERRAYNKNGIFYPVILGNGRVTGNWTRKDFSWKVFEGEEVDDQALEEAVKVARLFAGGRG